MEHDLDAVINETLNVALTSGYEYATVEMLLLSLLRNTKVIQFMDWSGIDLYTLYDTLDSYIEQNMTYLVDNDYARIFEPTVAFMRVVERTRVHAEELETPRKANTLDMLIAILEEHESYASYLLQKFGIDWLSVVQAASHEILFDDMSNLFDSIENNMISNVTPPLERYTTNLNEQAQLGKIDPLIGRENDVERLMQVLCRRRKNNPILVGEAGVGKTAIAEGLAWLIEQNKVPAILKGTTIYSFNISSMIAGTSYRGDFEKRFNDLVGELETQPKSILFIDEIHMIIGAGSAGENKIDTANLFKPLLSSGKIRVIGSTTYQEYRRIFEKDSALTRRFQKIDVVEPSISDSIKILQGLKSHYEKYHNVRYSAEALTSAVTLSVKYITDRFLPDKAIDLIDEAGAKNALLPKKQQKKAINVADIETIVAKIARVPEANVSISDKTLLQQLSEQLKNTVFGQNKAIDVLCDKIILNRAGLSTERKPIGSFLFAGPTGVGKTEITLQLAKALNIELLRFDMSEYREAHTISKLIGSPPGYVGYEQGGLLTDQVSKHPHAVLLLDEIEKAHADIYNLLLQIMDNGSLTDSLGRKVDFRNIIIVMTTNAGVQETVRKSIGFSSQDHSSDALNEINRLFSPEFRNRLDNIIWFEHLTKSVILQIVNKFIAELEQQLSAKNVTLTLSESAKNWLTEKGYDKTMGARPMVRTIQEHVKQVIANELLFGRLQQGGNIEITLKQDKLKFVFK